MVLLLLPPLLEGEEPKIFVNGLLVPPDLLNRSSYVECFWGGVTMLLLFAGENENSLLPLPLSLLFMGFKGEDGRFSWSEYPPLLLSCSSIIGKSVDRALAFRIPNGDGETGVCARY